MIATCFLVFFFPIDRLGKRQVKCAMVKMNDMQNLSSVSVSLLLLTLKGSVHTHTRTQKHTEARS